jgi:glycine cleavage system H protein
LPEATYPDDLRYHDQHGWVRLGEHELATLGITWYAQDSLGEVVSFEPPELGTTLTKERTVPRRSTKTRTEWAGWSK